MKLVTVGSMLRFFHSPFECHVRNRQVVFPRGQRPQHIVTCTGENMQETP
jgi:hypothetical protein